MAFVSLQALNQENIQTQLDDATSNYLSRNVEIVEEEKVSQKPKSRIVICIRLTE